MPKEKSNRKEEILKILKDSKSPVSGSELAELTGVSRQVIVQDIALLKAEGKNIYSTNRGYLLKEDKYLKRQVKVVHEDDEIEKELNAIVDLGVGIRDVFINHRVYGKIVVDMNIFSRRDVAKFIERINSGISSPLKNLTKNYHYHTLVARDEESLDEAERVLKEMGYLLESKKIN
ncbi:transcription repressor NadR [Peptoniphilus catoniae]|uniref:transcription repressor NadR n=1 Tax=Peptoniphilus catoniae TaxID=1660341 RepID=UPI0010FD8E16|nr:transcription repressor NadR [Peptoniphilus catoniae]